MLLLALLATVAGQATFDQNEPPLHWETLQVIPHVSGVRVESFAPENGFLGYTEAGSTIVKPDTLVNIVVFGYWLDKVEYVTFTDTVCLTSEFNISATSFILQTETKIELQHQFPDWEEPWRLCVKQKGRTGELLLIDDMRTWINSAAEAHEEFIPLWLQVSVLAVLFSMSALFSGLNLGLMSLSTQELKLIINSGSAREQKYAAAILPVRKRGNYLLCTILIMNVVVNASISILFEDFASGTVAFIVSSFGIVVLGEIIPQSICVKEGLAVGAKTIYLTRFFMFVTFPLAWPISKLLDFILGEDVDQFDRGRLVEMLKINADMNNSDNVDLARELQIAVGAMEISNKHAKDVMTKIDDVYMLPEDQILDREMISEIVNRGYTRIPIFSDGDRNNVTSLLFVKDLALIDKKHHISIKSVSEYHKHPIRVVDEDTPLNVLLEEFKAGEYHLALVAKKLVAHAKTESWIKNQLVEFTKHEAGVALIETGQGPPPLAGIITLEDILEEILQAEIIDESDSVFDNRDRKKRNTINVLDDCKEDKGEPLNLDMRKVVCHWLAEHLSLFSNKYIDERARERLVQRNIRKVVQLNKKQHNASLLLFEPHASTRRMILILEGKCIVTFPKSGLTFTCGPWMSFGESLMACLEKNIVQGQSDVSVSLVPDFEVRAKPGCVFLQVPLGDLARALKMCQLLKTYRSNHASESSSIQEQNAFTLNVPSELQELSRRRNASVFHPRDASNEERVRSVSTASASKNVTLTNDF